MGENINLDIIKNAAKTLNSGLEKQIEENRKKEKKIEMQYLIENMDKEDIKDVLDKNQGIYNQINYSINSKKAEIKALSKNPEVKRYITLMNSVEDLENEKKLIGEKIGLCEQKLCNHELLYLMTYPKKTMAYFPTFRCLCCGKSINGFINEDQIVINSDFLDEDEYSFKGNLSEYMNSKFKYFDLLDQGESIEEIIVEVQDYLNVKHNGVKKSVKLLRKKEDN